MIKKLGNVFGIRIMQTMLMASLFFVILGTKAKAAGDYSAWISVFDPAYYLAHDSQAATYAAGDLDRLWNYFVNVGIPNGVQASEEFNIFVYAQNYPELINSYGSDFIQYYIHYATVGKAANLNAKTLNATPSAINIEEKQAAVDLSNYTSDQIGFIILGESHAGVIGLSKKYFCMDDSLVTNVPKDNILAIANPSTLSPGFWGGGISLNANGRSYEAFSYINEEMDKHPNVKFWFVVYYAGTNDVKIKGDVVATRFMKENLNKLLNAKFHANHTVALITTAHFYGWDDSYKTKVDNYDDAELKAMAELGLVSNSYDARADFDSFTSGKKLLGTEYSGYRYNLSGDGIHFYASEYWAVMTKACNAIYNNNKSNE